MAGHDPRNSWIAVAKRVKMTGAEHSAAFAREHGAEIDEKAFGDAMPKLLKPKL